MDLMLLNILVGSAGVAIPDLIAGNDNSFCAGKVANVGLF
jgi:hypothetical protein